MEPNLKCNYPKCNVIITGIGCVTRCSHIFCEQHTVSEHGKKRECPACGSVLESPYSVMSREVNPSEEWKLSALIGYTPEMIFEAMTKALQFWSFQLHSELMFRKKGNDYWKRRLAHRERTLETMQLSMNQYIQMQTQKMDYYKNEVRSLTETINELEGIINEKTDQLLTLQTSCESLRRRAMASMMTSDEPMDLDVVNIDQRRYRHTNRGPAPPTPQFVFNPDISHHTPLSNFSASQSTPRPAPMSFQPLERSYSQRLN